MKFLQSRPAILLQRADENRAAAASGGTVAAASWKPFDASSKGAETVFQVRNADGQEASVVLNQHGQLLHSNTRLLLGWKPTEMQ